MPAASQEGLPIGDYCSTRANLAMQILCDAVYGRSVSVPKAVGTTNIRPPRRPFVNRPQRQVARNALLIRQLLIPFDGKSRLSERSTGARLPAANADAVGARGHMTHAGAIDQTQVPRIEYKMNMAALASA